MKINVVELKFSKNKYCKIEIFQLIYIVEGIMRRISVFLITILLPALLFAKGEGTSSASFLKIGIGARSAALSFACTALGAGVEGVYFNPASVVCAREGELLFMGARYIADINFGVVGYKRGRVAFLSKYLFTSMEGRDSLGQSTGEFSTSSLLLQCSAAKAVNKRWALGASVKMIREVLEEEQAFAFAADFGALYRINNRIRVGGALQNLGVGLKFLKERYPLPLLLRAGVALKLREGVFFASDVVKSRDEKLYVALGTEVRVHPVFSIRAGYCTRLKKDVLEKKGPIPTGVSCGFGIRVSGGTNVSVDYAFTPFGFLGSSHRVSISLFL
jgi:hypothetical protein